MKKYLCNFLLHISSCSLFLVVNSLFSSSSSLAAEKIVVRYGLFEQSVPIADLRKYAEKQEISPDLKVFLGYLDSKQENSLLKVLKMKVPFNVVVVDKLINSDMGKQYLNLLAPAIARRDNAGIQAIRSAAIIGAASPEGLGVLSFLEAYPSERIVVNLPVALNIVNKANMLSGFSGELLFNEQGSASPLPFELNDSEANNQK